MWVILGDLALGIIELGVMARAVLRPHRDPMSRIAWVFVIASLPVFGILLYFLVGETNVGRKQVERVKEALKNLPPPHFESVQDQERMLPSFPKRCAPLFRLGETVNGFPPIGGNQATLMEDSNSGIDRIVRDMDAATEHIHLIYYIWLSDHNGTKIVQALKRAAARGVACRAMADGLGSRAMIRSKLWQEMRDSGVKVGVALPLDRLLFHPFKSRVDLRNHRKIVVIDDRITYCGSQNCADPEFRVKAKFAPWVDILVRFEGPIARENQYIFVKDWMTYVNEDLRGLLMAPIQAPKKGFTAQVIATGPTIRNSAMPETFEALIYAATKRLTITTPYYVPNDALQAAICAAAHRGVDTTLILPARNDSWQIGPASRSYYLELLTAGVKLREYEGGLLHAKTMTVDEDVALIGSANMDRRSFDLNFENNILFQDQALTAAIRERQETYLSSSREVTIAEVEAWGIGRRLWNNTIGMLSPLL